MNDPCWYIVIVVSLVSICTSLDSMYGSRIRQYLNQREYAKYIEEMEKTHYSHPYTMYTYGNVHFNTSTWVLKGEDPPENSPVNLSPEQWHIV